jgi:hypothetical protein
MPPATRRTGALRAAAGRAYLLPPARLIGNGSLTPERARRACSRPARAQLPMANTLFVYEQPRSPRQIFDWPLELLPASRARPRRTRKRRCRSRAPIATRVQTTTSSIGTPRSSSSGRARRRSWCAARTSLAMTKRPVRIRTPRSRAARTAVASCASELCGSAPPAAARRRAARRARMLGRRRRSAQAAGAGRGVGSPELWPPRARHSSSGRSWSSIERVWSVMMSPVCWVEARSIKRRWHSSLAMGLWRNVTGGTASGSIA